MKSATAMYRSIALDLAQRIINGEFAISEKISGRSVLASHYTVSPETIRKAIALLKAKNVVSVSQGKEVTVISTENAYMFIDQYKSAESVYSLHQDVEILLHQKRDIDAKLEALLSDIINYSDKLRNLTPYNPVEVEVPESSHIVGHTIAEIRLWQHTGATVVAIRRGTSIIISPGPQAVIQPHDRVVVVGDSDVLAKTLTFVGRPLNK
ncbi:TrkA C-terminal domain-containing protein [Sporomusa acidovorans]|uniref:GntR family transcriptional regulator n=1 Tax=Sporomusa acidovorans (strain ATCC 49682 / DSM 3132 / Mol) TaxID=1123286 RepID=A0ABZ3IZ39_SPOA4|nr:TrkA C-terminal domain-containing protein [Sporomusa acidovorans]OZC18299.1 potassium transporter peripheral membrane component [Sporomusa acidovorans DSM 3132]SDF20651.1 transcriptional regulator, GntR family [Sporomusa acidovorans]